MNFPHFVKEPNSLKGYELPVKEPHSLEPKKSE